MNVVVGMVAFAVPALIVNVSGARSEMAMATTLLFALGLLALLACVREFYIAGKGTLAPWAPQLPFTCASYSVRSRGLNGHSAMPGPHHRRFAAAAVNLQRGQSVDLTRRIANFRNKPRSERPRATISVRANALPVLASAACFNPKIE